jgi:hypothetical protein
VPPTILAEFSAPLKRKDYELRSQKMEITPTQAPKISHEDELMAERWYCTVNQRSRSAVISDAPLYSTNAWAITTVFLRPATRRFRKRRAGRSRQCDAFKRLVGVAGTQTVWKDTDKSPESASKRSYGTR